jgi:hypothetical protein
MAVITRVGAAALLEGVLQGEGVDHRRQHAHVVALRAVHARARALEAAEDVASADDDADLHAEPVQLGDLGGDALQGLGRMPKPPSSPQRASPLSLRRMRR